jgi:hypothetical protein
VRNSHVGGGSGTRTARLGWYMADAHSSSHFRFRLPLTVFTDDDGTPDAS